MDLTPHIEPLIDWLAEGRYLADYCTAHGLALRTVQRAIAKSPNIASMVARARAAASPVRADKAMAVACDPDIEPHRARNIIDVIKWSNKGFDPAVWGDKQTLTVETVDISGALIEARKRKLQPVRNQAALADVQDAEFVTLPALGRTDSVSVGKEKTDYDVFD